MEDFIKKQFLRERWQDASEKQTQRIEEEESEALRSYQQIKKTVADLPEHISEENRELIKEYFEELQESIQRYVSSIDAFTKARISKTDTQDMTRLDESRRRMHDGLITVLEVLERLLKREGLDTSWRSVIGSNRTRVKEWAQEVTGHISREAERSVEE
ncbi:MAG: hypothetical protein WDZ82_02870 [Candidatus Paceibacterota bacterium]